ncbi:MAG: InlB B-repeat-containing protein [Candidatus Methanoplasma sp.]|jgi:hypothetical protein|nr:InlB B-repeat-containing protein [Candidatus Methanoplasma sp.]
MGAYYKHSKNKMVIIAIAIAMEAASFIAVATSDLAYAAPNAVSTPDDLKNIASDMAGDYEQTQDIDFTGIDLNGGYDLTVSVVSASSSDITFKVEPANGGSIAVKGYLASGPRIWTASSSGTDSANVQFTYDSSYSPAKSTLLLAGKVGSEPFAIAIDASGADASFSVTKSSNGNFDPIPGSFTGTYNGNGHAIIGLEVNINSSIDDIVRAGIFRELGAGATIENLELRGGSSFAYNSSTTGTVATDAVGARAGSIASEAHGTAASGVGIENVSNSNIVAGIRESPKHYVQEAFVGGLVAFAWCTEIDNSSNAGDVIAYAESSSASLNGRVRVGGLIGVAGDYRDKNHNGAMTVSDSRNEGNVIAEGSWASLGGLIGFARNAPLTITGSSNIGDVSLNVSPHIGNAGSGAAMAPNIYVGGLIGETYNALTPNSEILIKDSFNAGNVRLDRTTANVGYGYQVAVGGLAGYLSGDYHPNTTGSAWRPDAAKVSVTGSYNSGEVYSMTRANDTLSIGGIVGFIIYHDKIEDCYNSGQITVDGTQRRYAFVGGIAGEIDDANPTTKGIIANCYSYGFIEIPSNSGCYIGGFVGYIFKYAGTQSSTQLDVSRSIYVYSGSGPAPNTSGGNHFYGSIGAASGMTYNNVSSGALLPDAAAWRDMSSSYFSTYDPDTWGIYDATLYSGWTLPYLKTTNNNILVTVDQSAPLSAHPQWAASGNYDADRPLEGDLDWASGSQPASPGDYGVVRGTLGYDGAPPSGRNYQIAFDLRDVNVPALTVTYHGNGSDSGTVPVDPNGYMAGDDATVLGAGSLAKAGHSFVGWGLLPAGGAYYYEGDVFTVSANTDLHAQWSPDQAPEPVPYTITALSDSMTLISPSGSVRVLPGSDAAFSFSARQGYLVSSVEVDGVPLSSEEVSLGSYSFRSVSSNHTISVRGEADPGPGPGPGDGGAGPGDGGEPPQARPSGDGDWSALNLICAVLALFAGIIAAACGKRERPAPLARVVALILGIASVLVFILTEDMSLPVRSMDGWTLPLLALLIAAIAFAIAGFRLGGDSERE